MSTETFHSQIQFLCFLDSDKADLLWMDHLDLQMTANAYNIELIVLSLDLEQSNWTKIQPDTKLNSHTCGVCIMISYKMELPKELLVLHTENHYQIFVPKNSTLAETLGYQPATRPSQQKGRGDVSSPAPQVVGPGKETGGLEAPAVLGVA